MGKAESRLYDPIINALVVEFSNLGTCYFENTSRRFSEKLKEQLDDYSLFILNVEKMSPDLTGVLTKKQRQGESGDVIVVEVKDGRPTLKDIYQTKRYAEILKASYGLLVSPKKLSTERRKFIIKRKGEITQFYSSNHVLICQFNEYALSIQIDKELYYDSYIPEPFKSTK